MKQSMGGILVFNAKKGVYTFRNVSFVIRSCDLPLTSTTATTSESYEIKTRRIRF
jgi:hypothetical protein